MRDFDDNIKTCGVLREDRPVFVKVCARCHEAMRTNDREQAYCDYCNDEMCAMQADDEWMLEP